MGLMLDTSVFIYFEHEGKAVEFAKWEAYGDVYISSITVSELLVGVHCANNEPRRAKRSAFVESVLGRLTVVDFNTEVARVHAGLFATLSSRGQMIGAHDLIIAATALSRNCAVLTKDTDDFDRVPGLEVIDFLNSDAGARPESSRRP
ncbi:MAG: type II toxin-antitoxin system VapC family toxin [Proteobacteria bacterium]|nr:type II toxin-antitoxin system VapC family toxin [Pseudomonadota bacterium]